MMSLPTEPGAARTGHDGPDEIARLLRYVALVVGSADTAVFLDEAVFTAGQQAAQALDTVLAAAEHERRLQ